METFLAIGAVAEMVKEKAHGAPRSRRRSQIDEPELTTAATGLYLGSFGVSIAH